MVKLYLFLLMFLLPLLMFGQSGNVTGRVVANGTAVPYASIGLQGTSLGTTASDKGIFEIMSVPAGSYRLRVSAVGFAPFEKHIEVQSGQATQIEVVLEQSQASIKEVVVTGTMRETFLLESPVAVEVYTPKYFQKNPTPALFEALELVNGVQPQINCNVCGTGDIHINGMEGAYTMVLIDGMPVVSALSTVYGLSGIPNSLVERVEVVKGPASTLYGSEAVAGLINVITKSPLKAPRIAADVFYTSHEELNADVGLSRQWERASTILSTNYFRMNNRRDVNNDNFTDTPLQHRISLFNKWSLARKDNRIMNLAARYYYEDRFGGEMQWSPAFRAGDSIYGESVYTRRYELLGAYQLPVKEKLLLSYSYNDHDQNSAYGTTLYKGRQKVLFGQLVWDKALGARHNLLLGSAYRYTFYDDNTPATQTTNASESVNKPVYTSLPGVFVQEEFKASSATTLLAGLRYDYNSDHGSILTPRFNMKWSPDKESTLRLSLGNGYRVVNLFTEDHAALTGARKVVIQNELKPERSYNASLNYQRYFNLSSGYLDLEATTFYTYFTNKIVADFLTDNNLIIYDNLSGHAISRGVAVDLDMAFTFPLHLNAGLTLMDVYQVEEQKGEGRSMKVPQLHAPKFSATFAATYKLPKYGLAIDYTGSIKGPMHLPVQELDFRPGKSPWFTLQNIQLTKTFAGGLEVYGGVKNIFDFMPENPLMRPFDPFDKNVAVDNPNNYTFDTEYNYAPLQGRRTFIGVRYNLAQPD
ncbi:TonB-dependent receptor [Pontibacter ruber]|uniref:TonB-dependent receptor domain-containing protein n=1 Tax=Pontibacter ruber TaxID=1343895 RepID=A0ABW5CYR1_9BACT|nr:TonB-dependent receptor [Pontibacter ruber]